jgi:pteridine reductase
MTLKGRTAVVTGGAIRIGRAIAIELGRRGARVGIHFGSSEAEAVGTADIIRERDGTAEVIQADFSEPVRAASTVFEHAARAFGEVDILINNAAIFEHGTLSTTDEEHWDRHFDINLKAPFFLSQAFAQQLEHAARADIINITDWRTIRPGTDHAAYTLTKSALSTLTRILAQELAPRTQVNAVALGAILPPPGVPESYLTDLANRIPLRRTGGPQDVADAVVYLLESQFVTGQVITLSGGQEL